MRGMAAILTILLVFMVSCEESNSDEKVTQETTETVTDIDGNVYSTVQIGDQIWMVENLKVTHYRDGSLIPNISTGWDLAVSGAYCYHGDDNSDDRTYGALYNWYAVADARKIAPLGWHIPSDIEWQTLEIYLGMNQSEASYSGWRGTDEGQKLKESGSAHWYNSNNGTNESGFTALPGGSRFDDYFGGLGSWAFFWTSSVADDTSSAWYRALGDLIYYPYPEPPQSNDKIDRSYGSKVYGFSVRCVKD